MDLAWRHTLRRNADIAKKLYDLCVKFEVLIAYSSNCFIKTTTAKMMAK